jgi:hypothetical protein
MGAGSKPGKVLIPNPVAREAVRQGGAALGVAGEVVERNGVVQQEAAQRKIDAYTTGR